MKWDLINYKRWCKCHFIKCFQKEDCGMIGWDTTTARKQRRHHGAKWYKLRYILNFNLQSRETLNDFNDVCRAGLNYLHRKWRGLRISLRPLEKLDLLGKLAGTSKWFGWFFTEQFHSTLLIESRPRRAICKIV